MTVKALKSFSGERFAMYEGEIRDVDKSDTVAELLKIGYLEEVAPVVPEEKVNENKRGKSKRS